jgi:hypothetical protein
VRNHTLDANPVAGLGSLRKRLRRSAAVPYIFLFDLLEDANESV